MVVGTLVVVLAGAEVVAVGGVVVGEVAPGSDVTGA
jgi:hypothetical protein